MSTQLGCVLAFHVWHRDKQGTVLVPPQLAPGLSWCPCARWDSLVASLRACPLNLAPQNASKPAAAASPGGLLEAQPQAAPRPPAAWGQM